MMLWVVVAAVFLLGVFLALGLFAGLRRLPALLAERRLQERLREVQTPAAPVPGLATGGSSLVKTVIEGPVPSLDRLAGRTARGSALGRWIEQSGLRLSVSALLLLALLSGIVLALVGLTLSRTPLAPLIGGVIGLTTPFFLVQSRRKKRLQAFEENFPEALDLISRAVRAGHAFTTGMKMAADELEEPVGPEFRKTFEEQNYGLPLKDALDNLCARVPLLDVRFFATAILIQRDTGGNLAEILDNLASVVRERFKILRQVRVHTAHGRLTGYVLLGLPAALAITLTFLNADYINLLFSERLGQTMVAGAIVLQIVGYFWIRKVVTIEV